MHVLKVVLIGLIGVLLGANAVYYLMTRTAAPPPAIVVEHSPPPAAAPPDARAPAVRPAQPPPADRPIPPSATPAIPATDPSPAAGPTGLLMPVRGVSVDQLSNSFADDRGTERVHEALDIMAPRGTPVVAVADGHVAKLFDSKNGGLTLYQFEPGGTYAYYYAHLDRYAPAVVEGKPLRRGEVIGYVGSSGNASAAAPHLHFAVFVLGPEKQWWKGTPINPYPLLGGRQAAR